jgi:hypothetical protein
MPDQTITVQASGNLNSLAGKTIYVEVVDPDSLFSHSAALTVTAGVNNTYSTTLTGQVLNTPNTYHGNLQVLVATDAAMTAQLGNSPLSVPFSVTVTPVPTLTVSGSSLVTYLPFNAAAGTITPDAAVPSAYAADGIKAILPDAVTVIPGSYDPATGNYSIPHVPVGHFWLNAGSNYVWTDQSVVDLGTRIPGRKNVVAAGAGTTMRFETSGLDAWQGADYLELVDFNSNVYFTSKLGLSNNATAMSGQTESWSSSLMDTSKGDAPQFDQIVDIPQGGTVHLYRPMKAYRPDSLSMVDGAVTTMGGTMADIPQTGSFTINYLRSQFAAYRSQYNPATQPTYGAYLEFSAQPGAAQYGNVGQWLDGLIWEDWNPGVVTDVNLGSVAGYALPAGYEYIAYAGESFYLNAQLGGTTSSWSCKGVLRSYTLTLPDASHPMAPTVSPVKSPTINGLSLFANQNGVGLTPTLAWTAPDLGTPQHYRITVYRLTASGSATTGSPVATLYLDGTQTSAKIPTGILVSGGIYCFKITAYDCATYQAATAPLYPMLFPMGKADILSSLMVP